MRICLVAAFPPSGRQLTEYSFHLAREIQRHPHVELTLLADELGGDEFSAVAGGDLSGGQQHELPGFNVVRCWKFGSMGTPMRLLSTIRKLNPDVVWFNLVFSSFGTPDQPFAAFAGLSAPALSRAAGYYTHITLHHIVEHVDLHAAGVHREKIYRLGSDLATRALLKAHSVTVLLSDYRRTLMTKYSAQNVLLGTHGTFASSAFAGPLDFNKRGNPDLRVLAIGHWGTYKRLETLVEAFPRVVEKVPNARLIIGGGNHQGKPGYWQSIRDAQPSGLPIEFRGYIPHQDLPELFRTSSVLVMPYNSSTGSSGPAHQACEYGLPIVCADVPDFKEMAADEDMAVSFYKIGDPVALADRLIEVLRSPGLLHSMAERNYAAGRQMTMDTVVRNYLRWFELNKFKREITNSDAPRRRRRNRAKVLFEDAPPDDWGEKPEQGEDGARDPLSEYLDAAAAAAVSGTSALNRRGEMTSKQLKQR